MNRYNLYHQQKYIKHPQEQECNMSIAVSELDDRIRRYVSPVRIVWQEGNISNAEVLLQHGSGQATIWSHPGAFLAPVTSLLLDYGKELHGGVQIITGPSRDKRVLRVRVRFGESVCEAMGEPDNDHAIHDAVIDLATMGATEFGNTGFRFVRIDSVEKEDLIEIREIRAVSLCRDLKYRGAFECDDKRLNEIWQTGAYTTHLCLQDYIWDGIKRDRLVWMGDMHPEIMVTASVFGKLEVIERSLDLVRDEAVLPKFMNNTSSYSLWWIIAHYDWFRFHGDLDYLKAQREYLKELLRMVLGMIDANGSEKLDATWRFLDWPTHGDDKAVHGGLHALLLLALKTGASLCSTLGEKQCGLECARGIDLMSSHIPEPCMNKSANSLQVLAGMQDPVAANREILAANPFRGVSTFYGYYILQARAQAGDYQGCLDLISRYWGGMLDLGATTFWEHFELDWMENAGRIDELPVPDKKDVHRDCGAHCFKGLRHSLCHGWASGPTAWLSEHILGVKVLKPGARQILLEPHLPGLQWVRGSFPTPYGEVEIECSRKGEKIKIDYKAPAGVKVETAQ